MSVLNCTAGRNNRATATRRAKRGWIGIDVGTHAIKLAQLERYAAGIRIAGRWTLVDPNHALATAPTSDSTPLADQLSNIKTLKRLFSGSKCAAVLPTSLVEFRNFEVPAGSHAELQRMAGEELAVDLGVEPQELAFD